jgi:hypothetical protein
MKAKEPNDVGCNVSILKGFSVRPARIELATFGFVVQHSIQLSYGRIGRIYSIKMCSRRMQNTGVLVSSFIKIMDYGIMFKSGSCGEMEDTGRRGLFGDQESKIRGSQGVSGVRKSGCNRC